jgi:threonine dehydratase
VPHLELDAVTATRRRLGDQVVTTPLLPSFHLSERLEARVWLKAEHRQRTGSFKARGALNRLLQLDPAARERGVVTVSAGNHAAAVAWAAGRAGVDATVVMPSTAPAPKVDACHRHGARVVLHGDVFEALAECLAIRDREGRTLVHPFDDPEILEGTGTVALEILEQLEGPPAAVIVPVGGGGLIAGIAATLAAASPTTRVIGVEPMGADAMTRSLAAGRPIRLERVDTIADGLGAPMAGERTYPIVRDHVAAVVRVDDHEIARALAMLFDDEKQVLEPAGAAGVAALLEARVGPLPAGPVVVVLSGGNVGVERLAELRSWAAREDGGQGTGTGSARGPGARAGGG